MLRAASRTHIPSLPITSPPPNESGLKKPRNYYYWVSGPLITLPFLLFLMYIISSANVGLLRQVATEIPRRGLETNQEQHNDNELFSSSKHYSRYNTYIVDDQPRGYASYSKIVMECDEKRKERYVPRKKLGSGTYGSAFLSDDAATNSTVVIKKLRSIRLPRIMKEMKVMKHLCGGPNMITLLDVLCNKGMEKQTTWFVYPHVDNVSYKQFYPTLSDYDLRYYFYKMFKAMEFSHGKGILHRDLKPNNIMIDHSTRTLRVIDWGLAEFYRPGQRYSVHVATRMYKSPEILVDYERYDYGLDMWSLGCVIAGAVFDDQPFFYGNNDTDQLFRIAEVLGTIDLKNFIEEYELKPSMSDFVANLLLYNTKRKSWADFVSPKSFSKVSLELFDLLDRLLVYDPRARISASEALAHKYFDPVREAMASDTTIYEASECFMAKEDEEDEEELEQKK